MTAQSLSEDIKRIVSDEFGGDPVDHINVRATADADGNPMWHVFVILKRGLPQNAPVLKIMRRANDLSSESGDARFILIDYATVEEARERA